MKPINALNLHNFWCSLYKKSRGEIYVYRGKGLELSMLKNLLQNYDPYQIMAAMEWALDTFIDINIKIFSDKCNEIISESFEDELICKASFAMKKANKNVPVYNQIVDALENYIDEQDAFFPNVKKIDKAAEELKKLVEEIL